MTRDSTTSEEKSSRSYWGFVLWPVTIVALIHIVTIGCAHVARPRSDDPKYQTFKQKMLPEVGHKTTVVGKLSPGKLGWWLATGDWGLYIYATTTNQVDLDKDNGLNRFHGHTVKAVGTLQYNRGWDSGKDSVPSVPEHFFFDAADVDLSYAETW